MYTVINGKWSHLNGETLNPVDITQLSIKIDNMKPIAKITHRDKLTSIFHIINNNSKTVELCSKLFNQSDSTIAIINKKL